MKTFYKEYRCNNKLSSFSFRDNKFNSFSTGLLLNDGNVLVVPLHLLNVLKDVNDLLLPLQHLIKTQPCRFKACVLVTL